MDKHGIGTDATHAEHIETIKARQYAILNNDARFIPGYIGLALVDGYDRMGYAMSKPHMRADLETQLKSICRGERSVGLYISMIWNRKYLVSNRQLERPRYFTLYILRLFFLDFFRTREDVLHEQIAKYRQIFVQAEVKVQLLSQALRLYLSESGSGPTAACVAVPASDTNRSSSNPTVAPRNTRLQERARRTNSCGSEGTNRARNNGLQQVSANVSDIDLLSS